MEHSKGSAKGKVYNKCIYCLKFKNARIVSKLHFRLLEKQEQAKPKTSRRDRIKTRNKINNTETEKKASKQKVGSLKRNKIDECLANLTKMRREKGPN
jgi:hypothetical protein